MQENFPNKTDSIHIFDILKIIWSSKTILLLVVFFALISASVIINNKPVIFQSYLKYSIYLKPAFITEEKIKIEFKNLFYTKSVFDRWKVNNKEDNISFDDLMYKVVSKDGKEKFVKPNDKIHIDLRLSQISVITDESNFVNINSDEKNLANQVLKYTRHVNKILTEKYLLRSQKEISIFESLHTDFSIPLSAENMHVYFQIESFISAINNGMLILDINYPSSSVASNPPKKSLIYGISLLLGLLVGISIIFIRYEFKKYRERL